MKKHTLWILLVALVVGGMAGVSPVRAQTAFRATGGSSTNTFTDGNGVLWAVHIFNEGGDFEPTEAIDAEYLIVAGGGGGGGGVSSAGGGGGGGAGGLLEGTTNLVADTYEIEVGAGGTGGGGGTTIGATSRGNKGNNSSAFGEIAEGGGFGGRYDSNGGPGGSGGGAAARGNLNDGAGGTGTSGQGNDGGTRTGTSTGASSGGGAGGDGINGGANTTGRDGGAAVTLDITGADVVYAGGGAGGGSVSGGTSDTGGDGGVDSGSGSTGAANTGGGGGGGGSSGAGGKGGSGIVVVRYQLPSVSMQVLHEGQEIAVGATNTWATTLINTPVSRTYTVTNLSTVTENLLLTNSPNAVVFDNGTTSQNGFTISSNITGSETNIAPGASANFTVGFEQAALGSYTGTVRIANNVEAKNPYEFDVAITVSDPISDMAVYDGSSLVEKDSVVSLGVVPLETSSNRTFTVTNLLASALADLELTGTPAVIFQESGTTSHNGFSISSNIEGGAKTIAAGGSSPFTLQFAPTVLGTHSATVSIANNDPDKHPYTFEVTADTQVYLLRSNASGVADWNTAADWSDAEAPSDAKDYLATAMLRSPTSTGDLKFGGRSLTIGGSGTLVFQRGNDGVTTIDNLTLESGSLTTFNHGRTHTLQSAQPIQVGSAFSFTSRSGSTTAVTIIEIDAVLAGAGDISIRGRNPDETDKDNRVQFNQANTYSGTVRMMHDVTFIVAHANAVQNLTLNMQSGDDGRVTFNQDSTVGGLMGSRDIDFGTRVISVGNNDEDNTYSGEISNGGLTKIGTGTLTLSGANPYTGATAVSGGTLRINGSTAAGSAVTVNNEGTLAGNGTVGGSLTIQSGGTFLADGTKLTVGALTLDSGSILDLSGITLAGDAVELMNYASLSETFSTVNIPTGWLLHYNYQDSNTIALVKIMPSVFRFR